VGKGVGGWIWCKQCIHTYANAKMIPLETIPGVRVMMIGESKAGDSSMIYLIHCKNLCKCYHIPTHSTIKNEKKFHFNLKYK
jgi:hypothetical protein